MGDQVFQGKIWLVMALVGQQHGNRSHQQNLHTSYHIYFPIDESNISGTLMLSLAYSCCVGTSSKHIGIRGAPRLMQAIFMPNNWYKIDFQTYDSRPLAS